MATTEQKREEMIQEFLGKWFLLGGLISSDTYKRTMGVVPEFATQWAAYHLTFRRSLDGFDGDRQLIMAGHEWMLRQYFEKPLKRSDIELAIEWYTKHSDVKAFPVGIFQDLLETQGGEDIYLPIDIHGFPGGQTFLKGVPCMSFEGIGGFVTFIEPHMCRYAIPVIHATKSRRMHEVAPVRAEFGYRSDWSEPNAVAKMLAMFVGGGGGKMLTSCDVAEFMFPDYFKSCGTVGHEFMCITQDLVKGLDEAELEAMRLFVRHHDRAALLCDLVDAHTVGLRNAIQVMLENPQKKGIGMRVDSGDIARQCVEIYQALQRYGIGSRHTVFEDEVTPEKVLDVFRIFLESTSVKPDSVIPGAGGYYNRAHRDDLSAGFKRSWTGGQPNTKFSNSPGKEAFAGVVRVYKRSDVLVVAHVDEEIDGAPLYVPLVKDGRMVYAEDMDFSRQAARANATWNRYASVSLSPMISEWMRKFRAMRCEAQDRATRQ